MLSWKALLARTTAVAIFATVLLSAGLFVAIRAASASPGGPLRRELSFSGALRTTGGGVYAGPHRLAFRFARGTTVVCTAPAIEMVTPDPATGAFATRIELDLATPTACTSSLFDGGDVTYVVLVDGAPISDPHPIDAVPYAHFAEITLMEHDCPADYERDQTASPGLVCARTVSLGSMALRDEVVKVGTGPSAFWIDRYEAAVHVAASGAQVGAIDSAGVGPDNVATSGISAAGFQPATAPTAVALSHPGPPTGFVTWFQANAACRSAGKRLPSGGEWLTAATGTADDAMCNNASPGARPAAAANRCTSPWGAHDMIGNVLEWTDEWFASAGQVTSVPAGDEAPVSGIQVNAFLSVWPAGYGDGLDVTTNVSAVTFNDWHAVMGVPSAATRGGCWFTGPWSGVFAFVLVHGPASHVPEVGFRCVVSR